MKRQPDSGNRPRHRVYGLTIASDFPFCSPLLPATGEPDLLFTCHPASPQEEDLSDASFLYESPWRTAEGESAGRLYRRDDALILRLTGTGDYELEPGQITCRPLTTIPEMIEVNLLGPVLGVELEQRGMPALHASAVVVDGRAVAFLSSKGSGKSSLAASFVAAGHSLLTDDLLAVEQVGAGFAGQPGYPQLRLWPTEAGHFLADLDRLPPVLPGSPKRRVQVGPDGLGSFCGEPRLLACIYLPERRPEDAPDRETQATPVTGGQALMALLTQSLLPIMPEAVGWQPARLRLFTGLVNHVPIRHLSYPHGLPHLEQVRQAVLEDLQRLPTRP